MGNDKFLKVVKAAVTKYVNEHLDKSDGKKITEDDQRRQRRALLRRL